MESMFIKSADDSKLGGAGDERMKVRDELGGRECWVKSIQMKFNINKPNVSHAVSKTQLHKTRMGETWLDCNSHKKEQEVSVSLKFTVSQRREEAAWGGEGIALQDFNAWAALTLGQGVGVRVGWGRGCRMALSERLRPTRADTY